MKLVQYGKLGREKPGLIDNNGDIRDLSSKITRIDANVLSKNNLEKLKKSVINKTTIKEYLTKLLSITN